MVSRKSSIAVSTVQLIPSTCQNKLSSRRNFFSFPSIGNKTKEYHARKLVGYSMEQMFDVVSDVEHYSDFVPFCKSSLVTIRKPDRLRAYLVIGFPPLKESYTSNVTMVKPNVVKAVCTDGKLFKHLITFWRFSPGSENIETSCIIDFSLSFEFHSVLHSQLAHVFFSELVRQMESAFIEEAKQRYGKASVKTRMLKGVLPIRS